jgi:hypothetical protein
MVERSETPVRTLFGVEPTYARKVQDGWKALRGLSFRESIKASLRVRTSARRATKHEESAP